mmetsp:Transcript_90298/g.170221  ORF Transcript_90298/g.170221 Transcript_90298/m.170221 type:complete len:205 (-) Transcript_90298:1278-1892(-)
MAPHPSFEPNAEPNSLGTFGSSLALLVNPSGLYLRHVIAQHLCFRLVVFHKIMRFFGPPQLVGRIHRDQLHGVLSLHSCPRSQTSGRDRLGKVPTALQVIESILLPSHELSKLLLLEIPDHILGGSAVVVLVVGNSCLHTANTACIDEPQRVFRLIIHKLEATAHDAQSSAKLALPFSQALIDPARHTADKVALFLSEAVQIWH